MYVNGSPFSPCLYVYIYVSHVNGILIKRKYDFVQVMFLLETAGVPIEKVGKVLSLQPELVGCSLTKKLEVIAKFFLFHGFRREELGAMVADFPMLLKYSLSTLKPKLRYIIRVMELPLKEVVKFPR